MEKPTLIVDGNDFFTLEEFLLKIRDVLAPSAGDRWIHNLDALNDELYRGDEKPKNGCPSISLVSMNADEAPENDDTWSACHRSSLARPRVTPPKPRPWG